MTIICIYQTDNLFIYAHESRLWIYDDDDDVDDVDDDDDEASSYTRAMMGPI
jgi:hypothetical protein